LFGCVPVPCGRAYMGLVLRILWGGGVWGKRFFGRLLGFVWVRPRAVWGGFIWGLCCGFCGVAVFGVNAFLRGF
jgi:hypothetical protein